MSSYLELSVGKLDVLLDTIEVAEVMELVDNEKINNDYYLWREKSVRVFFMNEILANTTGNDSSDQAGIIYQSNEQSPILLVVDRIEKMWNLEGNEFIEMPTINEKLSALFDGIYSASVERQLLKFKIPVTEQGLEQC